MSVAGLRPGFGRGGKTHSFVGPIEPPIEAAVVRIGTGPLGASEAILLGPALIVVAGPGVGAMQIVAAGEPAEDIGDAMMQPAAQLALCLAYQMPGIHRSMHVPNSGWRTRVYILKDEANCGVLRREHVSKIEGEPIIVLRVESVVKIWARYLPLLLMGGGCDVRTKNLIRLDLLADHISI